MTPLKWNDSYSVKIGRELILIRSMTAKTQTMSKRYATKN
jgi:hypothetical protein